jgi:tetratricopeptide (TPR) repeat protein
MGTEKPFPTASECVMRVPRYFSRTQYVLTGLALLLSGAILVSAASWGDYYNLKDNAIMHSRQGNLYMKRQQYLDAIEEFKAGIRLNPYSSLAAPIYNDLGLAYRTVGDYALAYVSFQRACRIQPTYALFHTNLIKTYAMAGELPLAEATFRDILTMNPADAEVWFMLGMLYKERGADKAAKTCFKRFLKLQPESDMAQAARQAMQ